MVAFCIHDNGYNHPYPHTWDAETGETLQRAAFESYRNHELILACPEFAANPPWKWPPDAPRRALWGRWAASRGVDPEHYVGWCLRAAAGY